MKIKEITVERVVNIDKWMGKYNSLRHGLTVIAEGDETSKELFDNAHLVLDASLKKVITSISHLPKVPQKGTRS